MTAVTESLSFGTASYVVGIDLGTSHTVVAYAPLARAAANIELLNIPQRSTAGEVIAQPLLPSVRYQAAPGELGEAWQQPWPPQGADAQAPAVIGRWARDLGTAVPGRLVASAKSWLSHTGVDRTGTTTAQMLVAEPFLGRAVDDVEFSAQKWPEMPVHTLDQPNSTPQADEDRLSQDAYWVPSFTSPQSASNSAYYFTHTTRQAARLLLVRRPGPWARSAVCRRQDRE